MIYYKKFAIFVLILSLKTKIIYTLDSIEIEPSSTLRNNRQLYQIYTFPKRQTVISSGQIFTPDFFPNYQIANIQQYQQQQQQQQQQHYRYPLLRPTASQNLNQNLRPYSQISITNNGGKFIFPDALETSYTVKQTKQQINQQPKSQAQLQHSDDIRQNFDKVLGSHCRRSVDYKSGICQVAHQCLHIVRDFRLNGVKLDICSYKGNIPVICCPPEDEHEKDLNRISAKKCAEYNNFGVEMLKPSKRANHAVKKCEASVPLIVGGEDTLPGEYPHMAAIGWIKERGQISWACGGTLVSEIFILTAAHCTTLGGKSPNRVKVGGQQINTKHETNAQEFEISEIISHPKYNKDEYYNDIALIKLNKIVKFSKYVRPACLWFRSKMDEVEIVTATGWGRTRYLGPKSNNLLKVDLNMIDRSKCNELYRKEIKLHQGITNEQFCAGYLEGGKDTCQGDSGGPINVQMGKYNCINYVIGITSFGKFCAAPNSPGVYTKINSYLDWIENIVFKSI